MNPLRLFFGGIALMAAVSSSAQDALEYRAEALGNGSTGDFAPYFIGSLNGGKIVRKGSALLDVGAKVSIDRSKRFSWGAGAEFVTGYSTANRYDRWDASTKSWGFSQNRPAAVWIQQLYGEIKYRGLTLMVGQKAPKSALLDESLSSGDLTRSSNARGIPGVSIGFIDFQNIPLTNGWVQINGTIEYGRYTDDGFRRGQYNYYNWMLATDIYSTYKYCYFRTKPSMPFSVTVGMQSAGQFGGYTAWYRQGVNTKNETRGFHIKDIWKMFFPTTGNGNNFVEGNSLGSWDFMARYRFRSGAELSFGFQWPWEDGSGIGRRNGWDGLWGLYYKTPGRAAITGAAIEYLDFRNQSGPIHWAPGDFPGTDLTGEATGGDNYYNNDTYTAYTNYGMAIATPFLVSPIYNLNGYPAFQHNCARGIHMAVTGCIGAEIDYAVKYSWQQAWGIGRKPQPICSIDNSMLFDVAWNGARLLPGLKINAKLAFDAGRLRGNNFGAMLGVSYTGEVSFKKNKK